ncbi:MAG: PfkB family carbohydrate kinase [Pseudomonadota bacterium]
MNEKVSPPPAPATQSGHKPGCVLVQGEALVDLFDSGPEAGGAPFNVARSLAALQVPVNFITRVGDGDRWSDLLLQDAQNFGLSTQGFQRDTLHPTGTVHVVQKGAAHTFRIAEDVAWDYLDVAQAQSVLQTTQPHAFVYFGTLAQRHTVSKNTIRDIIRTSDAVCYLDLNLRDGPDNRRLAEESLELADWVKVNDEELMQLLAWQGGAAIRAEPWGSPAFNSGVARLMDHYQLQRLIVTRGPLGYASFDASGRREAQGDGIDVAPLVDTVGAGDGFSAMFLACQLAGHTLAWSLALANEYAAAICSHRGPMDHDIQTYAAWRKRLAASTVGNAA